MMKKILSAALLLTTFQLAICQNASAQKGNTSGGSSYDNAVGMRVEFGSDFGTFVGFSGKHFFDQHNAGEAQLLFGDHIVLLEAEYQYYGDIPNAAGLKWYAGLGPGLAFSKNTTDLILRPLVGLDYKINNVPLNFSFDWRPAFVATHDTQFVPARFGLGFRYAF